MLQTRLPNVQTPYYFYDTELLAQTLNAIKSETCDHDNWHVHYAIKANTNPTILRQIAAAGFGADCVSGGEIQAALDADFPPSEIVFAGVGKADWEIRLALKKGIAMFNVESIAELEVIHELATLLNTHARVSFRINPDVGAHTHANITTGRAENKFGIAKEDMVNVIRKAQTMDRIEFTGLHFHIGSQLLEMDDFGALCSRINELQNELDAAGLYAPNINVGGGLGIDYQNPDAHPVPNFKAYFDTYSKGLQLRKGQHLHFELGRAIVGQMGSLITRVLYIKEGTTKKFVIVDAGMTDLIRPALYGAYHKIENITAGLRAAQGVETPQQTYDVVGPICESSDVFVTDYSLPTTRRGDIVALRSAGAYGEIMASGYNCRPIPKGYTAADCENC